MSYRLREFGSYTVGGRVHHESEGKPFTVNFTRTARHEVDPRGHFAVEHGYVQYFVPEDRNSEPPMVLVHGGGLSGSCWETTPDGRPGWLQGLLRRGFEVHVIDNVERGRAGFAPGLWDDPPLLRSLEEAWTLFRFGPAEGFASRTTFSGQLFPAADFDAFARSFVPRWLSTTAMQTRVLLGVLERVGRAHVVCHSQGGEVTFDAFEQAPEVFASIIALEPSGYPSDPEALGATPVGFVMGDFLDIAPVWRARCADWLKLAQAPKCRSIGPEVLGPGNSHMLMHDTNSEAVLTEALSILGT
ncbi:MAG: alpha/beta fold hydrolase [Pseudomonadota bacterium]